MRMYACVSAYVTVLYTEGEARNNVEENIQSRPSFSSSYEECTNPATCFFSSNIRVPNI